MNDPIPVFRTDLHAFVRVLAAVLLGMMLLACVMGFVHAAHKGDWVRPCLGLPILALALLLGRGIVFRTSPVFLVDAGLEVWRHGQRELLAFSSVERVDWAWWCAPPLRVAVVEALGHQPIAFFADPGLLRTIREALASRKEAPERGEPPR